LRQRYLFIDAGEFYPGGVLRSMQEGVDCPTNAAYLNSLSTDEQAIPMVRPRMACVFEMVSGGPAWRHFEEDQV
jgi:primary-amine oxidase